MGVVMYREELLKEVGSLGVWSIQEGVTLEGTPLPLAHQCGPQGRKHLIVDSDISLK